MQSADKKNTFRGQIYQSRSFDLCAKCPAHCCTGKGKFGFVSVCLEDHEADRPVFKDVVKRHDNGRAYFDMGDQCQFLGTDNRCTIYADRPEACRNTVCLDYLNPYHRVRVTYKPWQTLMKKHGYGQQSSLFPDRLEPTRLADRTTKDIDNSHKFRLIRVGRGQFSFIAKFIWHDEEVTLAIHKLPTGMFGAVETAAKLHRMRAVVRDGVIKIITPQAEAYSHLAWNRKYVNQAIAEGEYVGAVADEPADDDKECLTS